MVDSESHDEHSLIEATNKFYTIIPHNCGLGSLPLLSTTDQIKAGDYST